MAHGWDPCTRNVSLSSEHGTPEPEVSHPQHADEFIGHSGYSSAVISNEPSATNSNYYYSHSIGAANSGWTSEVGDCQRQYQPTAWQGEQKYLQRWENIEPNFTTDVLASPGHCPFAPQLEGHTQDCSVPAATSFYDDYLNVSNSTDAELGEPRSSCKFMTSTSVLKPKTDAATTSPCSQEWLQNHNDNILPSDYPYPDTNLARTKEIITICTQDGTKSFGLDGFSSGDMISHTQSKNSTEDNQSWKQEGVENASPNEHNSCHSGYMSDSPLEENSSGNEDQNMIDAKDTTGENTDSREAEVTGTQGTNTQMDFPKIEHPVSVPVSEEDSCQESNNLGEEAGSVLSKSDDTKTNDSKSNLLIQGAEFPSAGKIADKIESHIEPDANSNFDTESSEEVPAASCTNVNVSTSSGGSFFKVSENQAQSNLSIQNASPEENTSTCESSVDRTDDNGQSIDGINKQSGQCDSESVVDRNTKPDKETSVTSCTNLAVTWDDQSVNKCSKDEQNHNSDKMDKQTHRESDPPRQCEEDVSSLVEQSMDLDKLSENPAENSSTGQTISKSPEMKDTLEIEKTPQLKPSIEMSKRLQPVVLLKTLDLVDLTNNLYMCAECMHTTSNLDRVIDHHHSHHLMHSFQLCRSCGVYLVPRGQSRQHVCGELPLKPKSYKKKRRKLYCIKCQRSFPKHTLFVSHMRAHTGKTPYKCEKCGLYFSQDSALRRHKAIPIRCRNAIKKALTGQTPAPKPQKGLVKSMFNCYVKVFDIAKTPFCKFCGKCFKTELKTKKHLYNVHKKTQKQCKTLTEIIEEVHSERKYKCPICPRFFQYSYNRSRHLKDCVKEVASGKKNRVRGRYQCPLCLATFSLPSNRYRHIHTFCLRNFVRVLGQDQSKPIKITQPTNNMKSVLNKLKEAEEQLQCHPTDNSTNYDRQPQYKCNLCPAVFFNSSGKYRHMKKHELFDKTGRVLKYKYSLKKLTQMKRKLTAGGKEEQHVSLKCNFCEKSFGSSRTLKMHEYTHKGERPYHCLECGKGFKRHPDLLQHKVTHQRRIQCTVCRKILPTIGELIKHRKTHPNKGFLQCPDCPQQFKHPAFLLRHLPTHQKSQNKTFQRDETQETLDSAKTHSELTCPLCSEVFDDTQSLRKHSLTHIAKSSSPQCPFCKRKFTDRRYLLRHMNRHIGGRILFCKCGKRFFIESNFKLHRETCPENKAKNETNKTKSTIVCRICSRSFYRQIHLSKHYWGHKNNTLILCKGCKMYYGASKLYEHYKICQPKTLAQSVPTPQATKKPNQKTKGDKYECPYCAMTFKYPCYYFRHLSTHRDVESHACIHCAQNFPNKTLCFQHEASCDGFNTIESSIKQEPNEEDASEFKCKFCNKVFTKSQNLRRHILTHNEVKPYRCKACDSCFSRYDHLKGHLGNCKGKTKMQLRPEVCIPKISLDQVGTGWQKEFGGQHLKEEQPLDCEECGIQFATLSKLTWHNSMFHSIKNSSQTNFSSEKQNTKILARLQPTSSNQNLIKSYKCNFCPRTFRTSAHLKAHKHLHTGEKSFVCDCGKTFFRKENLRHHRTVCVRNLQSPPHGFSCAYCSSRFLLFSQLQEHFLNAHELDKNDKPLKTAPLQQHLSDIQNLNESPLDVSEPSEPKESPFTCKICNKGYWNKTLLRNHFRKCRRMVSNNDAPQVEVPLRADIDLALTDPSAEDSPEEFLEKTEPQSKPSQEKKTAVYQCSECDQSFTDGLLLISHLEAHGREEHERRLNKCSKCGKMFANQARLKTHMRCHENGVFVCTDCSTVLSSKSELENHKRTYHNSSYSFSCRVCSYRFKNKEFLCDHYSKEHPNDSFSCSFCNKSYTLRTSLIRHNKKCPPQQKGTEQQNEAAEKSLTSQSTSESESEDNDNDNDVHQNDDNDSENSDSDDSDSAPYFPCHVCGKTFQTSESLEDHQRCHLGEKPHECEQCGQCFFQAAQLQQHQRKHKSEFQCRICGRGFVTLFALRKHKHTTGKKRPFQCSKCHLCFTSVSQLAEHKLSHREENFPCDICNRVFASKSSRAEHRKIHLPKPSISLQPTVVSEHKQPAPVKTTVPLPTNEFKYRCGACCLRFRNPEELSEHGCIASVERQYSCLDCDKHFLHSSHLQKHLSTHKQPWSQSRYPCNQCNNNFSSSLDFLNHLRNHDSTVRGGPSFICPVCHQRFPSATELVYHFPMHPHGKFQCKTCNMSCLTESKLKEHEKCHLKETKCSKCGQGFLGDDAFRKHDCSQKQLMKTKYSNVSQKDATVVDEDEIDVTGEDLCCCPFCPMQFSSKSHLLEHQNRQHRKENPFICEICGKSFSDQKHLSKHLKKRHSSKKDPAQSTSQIKYQCAQCHSEFNSAKELSIHLKLHAAEKEVGEYRCDMCYKSYSQLRLLRQHQESHVGQVVYECTECDKAFAFPHLLEEHQQSHA